MANGSEPWGLPSLNYINSNPSWCGNSNNVPVYNNRSVINTPSGRVFVSNTAPPLPVRPRRTNFQNSYLPFNRFGGGMSYYGGYGGYGGYGDYGSYGGYGNYGGYGFGSRPFNSYPESRFIQLAEESSRPAFESVQSVLQAFSSVTMMFESSFHAIYSSYMSVLGVADNLGKLRNVFGQIFSAFAVFRSLGWLFRRILFMLGVSKSVDTESVWSDALNGVSDTETKSERKRTWPTLIFLSVIIGGPYLLFKLMSELYPNPTQEVWVPAEQPGSLAVGLYQFCAGSDDELSFIPQQKLMIAPKKFQPYESQGWLLACDERRKVGLIPKNYIGLVTQSKSSGETFIEQNGQTYHTSIRQNPKINTEHIKYNKAPEDGLKNECEETETLGTDIS